MFGTGGWEWIVVALVVLVLFGSRLPKVMRSLGSSLTEFKKGVNDGEHDTNHEEDRSETETHTETKSP